MKFLVMMLVAGIALSSCVPTVVHFHEREKLAEVFEDIPGSRYQLFLKANNWMTEALVNAESVIQHFEEDEGVIIGSYCMFGGLEADRIDNRVYAIIEIRVRDNNARIEIRPQERWRYSSNTQSPFTYSKDDARFQMARLSKSFYNALVVGPDDLE
jgi:hypothetical protein